MLRKSFTAFVIGVAAMASASAAQVLTAETQLEKGQFLSTRSGLFSLVVQDDGNVVQYFTTRRGTRPSQFSTNTRKSGDHLRMQMDGNLALYKSNGTWAWTSGTGGHPYDYGYKLVLYETGRLAILDAKNAIVKILADVDRPSSQGGPVDYFPFRKVENGNCTDGWTSETFQSGLQAEDWAFAHGGSVGYCNSPY
jgi:hypothetical protein